MILIDLYLLTSEDKLSPFLNFTQNHMWQSKRSTRTIAKYIGLLGSGSIL